MGTAVSSWAPRSVNKRIYKKLGPATGFDSIGNFQQSRSLASFMNELYRRNELTKIILYNLNPADNEVMATMTGNLMTAWKRGKYNTVPPGGASIRKMAWGNK